MLCTDICDLFPGQIINFGDITKLEEWNQYNDDSAAKQQADFFITF